MTMILLLASTLTTTVDEEPEDFPGPQFAPDEFYSDEFYTED